MKYFLSLIALILICQLADAQQDSDKDGIPDSEDVCPYDKGTRENKGCPVKDATKPAGSNEKVAALLKKVSDFYQQYRSTGSLTFELAGDSLIINSDYGRTSVHGKDLLYATKSSTTNNINLWCKYNTYKIKWQEKNSEYKKFEKYISFALYGNATIKQQYEFINLLNEFVFEWTKVPLAKRLIYSTEGKVTQAYTYTEPATAKADLDVQKHLNALNQFLKTFDNQGSYDEFSLKGDTVIITRSTNHHYRFHIKDVNGAIIEMFLNNASITSGLDNKNIVPSYTEQKESDYGFSLRGTNGRSKPYNYAELANLLNRFLFAVKKQPVPDLLVFDETIYKKTTNEFEDALANAKTPLDKAVAEFNYNMNYFPYGNNTLEKIILQPSRNVITFYVDQRTQPFLLLDRLEKMKLANYNKKDPHIEFVSSKKGYCFAYRDFEYEENAWFGTEADLSQLEKFYLYFGNIINAWQNEKNIKREGPAYADILAKLKSNLLWEIKKGKTILVSNIVKNNEPDYKSLRKYDGMPVLSEGLSLNDDLETYNGYIRTGAKGDLLKVQRIRAVVQKPAPIMTDLGMRSLGDGFYEYSHNALYTDKKFMFKKDVYRVNLTDNRIELLDFANGRSKGVVQMEGDARLVAAVPGLSFIYYAVIENERYQFYRYKPETDESYPLFKTQHPMPYRQEPDPTRLTMAEKNGRIFITYTGELKNASKGSLKKTDFHFMAVDNEFSLREISFYEASNLNMSNSPWQYSGYLYNSGFHYSNSMALVAKISDKQGNYQQLAYLPFDSVKRAYAMDKPFLFDIPPAETKVETIFDVNGVPYAITAAWENATGKKKTRALYKLSANGQLSRISFLGTGNETDYLGLTVIGDDILIKSFSTLYKYNTFLDLLEEVVKYDDNTGLMDVFYKTHNGKIIFEKYTLKPLGSTQKMLYDPLKKKITPISDVLNSNPEIKNESDPYALWLNTDKASYVLKETNKSKALYRLDFNQNKAIRLTPPPSGKLDFAGITDYEFNAATGCFWLKAKFGTNNKTEERLLLYKCE